MGSRDPRPPAKTHLLIDVTFNPHTGHFTVLEALSSDSADRGTMESHTIPNTSPGLLRSLLSRRLWDLERTETHRQNPPIEEAWVAEFMRQPKPQERL